MQRQHAQSGVRGCKTGRVRRNAPFRASVGKTGQRQRIGMERRMRLKVVLATPGSLSKRKRYKTGQAQREGSAHHSESARARRGRWVRSSEEKLVG